MALKLTDGEKWLIKKIFFFVFCSGLSKSNRFKTFFQQRSLLPLQWNKNLTTTFINVKQLWAHFEERHSRFEKTYLFDICETTEFNLSHMKRHRRYKHGRVGGYLPRLVNINYMRTPEEIMLAKIYPKCLVSPALCGSFGTQHLMMSRKQGESRNLNPNRLPVSNFYLEWWIRLKIDFIWICNLVGRNV